MIFATFNASIECEAAEVESRSIKGVAVPWNQIGVVSDGRKVKFLPDSLDAEARPIVTLGHSGAAIGRVTNNTATDTGMSTNVKVSKVRDGDDALVLASDGVLGMFSVGAEPSEFSFDGDVMVVAKAEWQHLALLPFGAFTDAVVESVAASTPQGEQHMLTEVNDGTASGEVVGQAQPPALVASAPTGPTTVPISAARPVSPPLTLQRIATLVAQANRGEISTEAVKSTIQAALANVTSTNIGSIVPPIYRSELTAVIDHGTPLLNVLNNQTLPASGMSIEWPQWDDTAANGGLPTTGIQAVEKTQIVSTAVKMALKSSAIVTLAGGNDISLQAVERSSPSFLEAYLRAAAVDWGRKAEAYVLSILTPLATVVAPAVGFLAQVQALLSALTPALTPAGPLFVAMSYDVAMPLIGVKTVDGPAFWSGSISFGSMQPTVNADGLNIIIDWNLPAKTLLAGSTQAATIHKSAGAPADIRVVDVSLLGLDVGVYGYIAVTPEYPKALAVMTLP